MLLLNVQNTNQSSILEAIRNPLLTSRGFFLFMFLQEITSKCFALRSILGDNIKMDKLYKCQALIRDALLSKGIVSCKAMLFNGLTIATQSSAN